MWVALFAAGLAGLVFLQGELRGLNSRIGTEVQSITKLERQNSVMRAEISSLTSDRRIYAEAARMGFVEPPVGASKYLSAGNGDARRALTALSSAPAISPASGTGLPGATLTPSPTATTSPSTLGAGPADPSGGDVSVAPVTPTSSQAATAASATTPQVAAPTNGQSPSGG